MNKILLPLALLFIYVLTMIVPNLATTSWHNLDAKNSFLVLHYGIFHLPSIAYIISSAILLHLSVSSAVGNVDGSKKSMENEIEEAIEILNDPNKNVKQVANSTNSFIQEIRTILLNGAIEEDMELVVEKRVSQLTAVYEKLISEYSYIATILPMLGMLGTITGLLQMFAVSDGIDNIAQKMAGLSVALATTLYATLWVILYTKPKSREIENNLIEITNQEHRLVIQTKLFLHNADLNLLEDEVVQAQTQREDNETLS